MDGETPAERKRPHPNDDAIRLYLIDSALQHLTRQQGILGLGANAVQSMLREEREEVVARLQALGAALEPADERRRA